MFGADSHGETKLKTALNVGWRALILTSAQYIDSELEVNVTEGGTCCPGSNLRN
jgi:hypothetical protein